VLETPDFKYSGQDLYLILKAPNDGKTTVRWVAVDDKGRPTGKKKKKKFEIKEGNNELKIEVGDEGGHRLKFDFAGKKREVYANRGTWFVMPKQAVTADSLLEWKGDHFVEPTDVILAKGYSSTMGLNSPKEPYLTLGRTLGYESSKGIIANPKREALMLVAHGTVGPVKITLAHRVSKETLHYYDFQLFLTNSPKRYVINLDRFVPRGKDLARLDSIHSVTIRALHPSAQGDTIVVGVLGLTSHGPVLEHLPTGRQGPEYRIKGPDKREMRIISRDMKMRETSTNAAGKQVRIFRDAKQVWLCYKEGPKSKTPGEESLAEKEQDPDVCDPPDAPMSAYAVPSPPGGVFVLVDFKAKSHVNAYRLPVVVFGATDAVERDLRILRQEGTLRITIYPQFPEDYGGYLTYFPVHMPTDLKTLEIRFRAQVPPAAVRIGYRDADNREARIPLPVYLDLTPQKTPKPPPPNTDKFSTDTDTAGSPRTELLRTVRIPVEAFRATLAAWYVSRPSLEPPQTISVTMLGSVPAQIYEIELNAILFTPEVVPLAICRFDGEEEGRTALGGVIVTEAENGSTLALDFKAEGARKKGLELRVSSKRPEGYALVALNTGRLDTSDYSELTFAVKGTVNGPVNIYLNDGKKRAAADLSDYILVTNSWQKVAIPLVDFRKKGVDTTAIAQVVLAWEGRTIERETIFFDEFVLE